MVQPLARPFVELHALARLTRGPQTYGGAAARLVHEPEVLVVPLAKRLVRHFERVVKQGADGHVGLPGCAQASLTGFSSVPSPVISSLHTSPGPRVICGLRVKPTPAGVPVAMRSPGDSVMMLVRYWMM